LLRPTHLAIKTHGMQVICIQIKHFFKILNLKAT
jgi:hypothetical protein